MYFLSKCIIIFFVFYVIIMANSLTFTSYNSQGHGAGRFEYIQKLVNNYDFVFVQEHWLLNKQCNYFDTKIQGVKSLCISGMNDSVFLQGRPFGGCAILWKDSINANITPINVSCNRVCALSLEYDNNKIVLCNVYMPCNSYIDGDVSQFKNVLDSLSAIFVQ